MSIEWLLVGIAFGMSLVWLMIGLLGAKLNELTSVQAKLLLGLASPGLIIFFIAIIVQIVGKSH